MEGWLTKSPLGGGLLSRHRRRYCTLRGAVLDWSADEQQHARGEPLGRVSIEGAQVVRQKAAELTLMLTGGQKLVLRGDQLDRWEAAFKEATLGAASSASPSAVTLSEKTLLVPQLSFSSNAPTELRSLFQSAVEAQRRDGASTYAGAEQLFGPRGVHPGRWGISKKQFEEFGESVKQAMRKGEIATQPDPSKRFYYPQSKFDNPNIGPNMHQVTRDLIKPRTAKHSMLPGASYAMLQNLSTCGLLCSLFISHCWDEGVFEFIRNTLKAWPDDCEGAYVCFLSNPQVDEVLSKIGLDGGISASPFYRVLHEKPRPKLMLMLANGNTPIHSRLCTLATLLECSFPERPAPLECPARMPALTSAFLGVWRAQGVCLRRTRQMRRSSRSNSLVTRFTSSPPTAAFWHATRTISRKIARRLTPDSCWRRRTRRNAACSSRSSTITMPPRHRSGSSC